ncbi:MAG TPA: hypothetical protein DDW87_10560 [Firmicutes bacterium]|nr:hypothetical protein [Bacillota bacterium]
MKNKLLVSALCIAVLFVWIVGAQASGIVTFRVNVTPGMTISSPGTLEFESVAPDQTLERDLNITVWSNVDWQLTARSVDYDQGGLQGVIEAADSYGSWHDLGSEEWVLRRDELPTGASGLTFDIPFRFTGSYSDAPDTYEFQIQLTVVSAL